MMNVFSKLNMGTCRLKVSTPFITNPVGIAVVLFQMGRMALVLWLYNSSHNNNNNKNNNNNHRNE